MGVEEGVEGGECGLLWVVWWVGGWGWVGEGLAEGCEDLGFGGCQSVLLFALSLYNISMSSFFLGLFSFLFFLSVFM